MKFVSLTRAFIRKFARENESSDVNLSGPKFKIPLNLKGEAIETRVGFKKNDKSPFYDSDIGNLYHIYHDYSDSEEFHQGLLYADVVGIRTENTIAIRKEAIDATNLKITVDPISYKLPITIKEHGEYAIECFKELGKISKLNDEWENNESLKVVDVSTDSNSITCRKACYFDQIATNLTLDWRSKKLPDNRQTIRNSIEKPISGRLKTLRDSNLANTLGVAVMLYNSQFEPYVRIRSDSLAAIPKKGLHCSASGVFEMEGGIQSGEYDYSIIEKGIEREIKTEIGIDRGDYSLYPVAFARELPRGGKPQLFFIAITDLCDSDIVDKSKTAEESWEFIDESDLEDHESKSGFKATSDIENLIDQFTYEGWACLQFSEDFLEANKSALGLDQKET
ncbi:hypothetical protein [Shewanella colwelliana]|uniref:hypothetical protein n=1 Tax=Shewanella colwelliana TaxID=23 RepID=UPI0022B07EAC|nr:hypothetical protein [Shewanella colwelliana]MCZ4339279.1 hypothetical protein [Shewanella colwelliana]